MVYNHDLPRLKELRETDRRTFVCAGFQKNDGLRDAADLLGLFFGAIIILGMCLIGGGAASDNILLICSLKRKADLLDYQLMIAFPDWKELIASTEKTDKEADNGESL